MKIHVFISYSLRARHLADTLSSGFGDTDVGITGAEGVGSRYTRRRSLDAKKTHMIRHWSRNYALGFEPIRLECAACAAKLALQTECRADSQRGSRVEHSVTDRRIQDLHMKTPLFKREKKLNE